MTLILSGYPLFGGEVLKIRWLSGGSNDPFCVAVGFEKTVKGNKLGNLGVGLAQAVGEFHFRMEHILIPKHFNDQCLNNFAFSFVRVRLYRSWSSAWNVKGMLLLRKACYSSPGESNEIFCLGRKFKPRAKLTRVRWLIWNCQSQAEKDCFYRCVLWVLIDSPWEV